MTIYTKLMVTIAATAIAGLSVTPASAEYKKHPRVLSEAYSSSSAVAVKGDLYTHGIVVKDFGLSYAEQENGATVAVRDGYGPATGNAASNASSDASTTDGSGGNGGYGGGNGSPASTSKSSGSNGGGSGGGGSTSGGTSASASGSSSASGSTGGNSTN